MTNGPFYLPSTTAHPSGAKSSRRSTLSPVRRAYQAVVLVGYAVLGVAVPMAVHVIREWRKP